MERGVFLRADNVRKALAYLAKRFAVLKATVQQDGTIAVVCQRNGGTWQGFIEPHGDIYKWGQI